ncbi:MAG: hypothetical protein ACPHFX_05795, partial [Paracoccaceae bacterium]
FLSELFGQIQQPASAGQESAIAPWQEETQEPVEEQSLREIVAQQLPFYPLLIAEKNYESSLRCLDQIQYLFDQKNEQGAFTIIGWMCCLTWKWNCIFATVRCCDLISQKIVRCLRAGIRCELHCRNC